MPESAYQRKLEIARHLIESGCVQLRPQEPFTYASGLTGPIYCDNRLILSDPARREWIVRAFGDLLNDVLKGTSVDALCGVATAGIPHAAILAFTQKLPMIYVRPEKKAHGKGNRVEGLRPELVKTILIEDLINQGGSLAEAIEGVKAEGLEVTACLSIVDYQMQAAQERFAKLGVSIFSLTDFDHLVEFGVKSQLIDQADRDLLQRWRLSPTNWQ
jgi:orotate phosphoribosyltransferase